MADPPPTALTLYLNDPQAAERVVDSIRRAAKSVPVLMRTPFLLERGPLFKLGVRDIVADARPIAETPPR